MSTLIAARLQMEVSLGFHMIFAALGIGMPLLMVIAEWRFLKTGQSHYRAIAKKWAKATALTFAVGAVSGTALSFELGLLWPRFMGLAGGVVGPAFALEGYAFFIEAIFLGLYLYGWDRLTPRAHWLAGIPIAVSGLLSGILVVAANAFMQAPGPFQVVNGRMVEVSPWEVFASPAWFHLALHSSLSCYIATGFAVAGVYAAGMLRGRTDAYHRSALNIALVVGGIAALLQPLSGDYSARKMVQYQPAKLAAAEAHYETRGNVPLLVGGIPDGEGGVRGALKIPSGLSLLVGHHPSTVVQGLNDFPADERPPVGITHVAFQLMVGCGFAMAAVALWYFWRRRRDRVTGDTLLLRALLIASPLGFLALEAGWIVTEVGRQPWMIYGVLRTSAGVTPVNGVPITLFGFSLLYLVLGIVLVFLLRALAGPPAIEAAREEVAHAR